MLRKLSIMPLFLLALGQITACDDGDHDRSEARSHEIVGLSAWEHDGTAYTMLTIDGAVRIVAENDDVVAIADEDGGPLTAAARGSAGPRYADVALLLADDRIAIADAPAADVDATSLVLLDLVLHDELELADFRAGLVADTEPEQLSIACAIDWVVHAVDNAINTPELMMPSLSDWCG